MACSAAVGLGQSAAPMPSRHPGHPAAVTGRPLQRAFVHLLALAMLLPRVAVADEPAAVLELPPLPAGGSTQADSMSPSRGGVA